MLRSYVWDLPVRAFHWATVSLLGFSWWSAENDQMEWHYRSGLTLCMLVLFRLIWGIIGSRTARFSNFIKSPATVLRYLSTREAVRPPAELGHNPVGGWSVFLMLSLLVLQIATGLFAVDVDGIESGPLSYLLDFDQGRATANIHAIAFNILLATSAIHVLAILYYLVIKRQNLIGAMIFGYLATESKDRGIAQPPLRRVLAAMGLSLALTWALSKGLRF